MYIKLELNCYKRNDSRFRVPYLTNEMLRIQILYFVEVVNLKYDSSIVWFGGGCPIDTRRI